MRRLVATTLTGALALTGATAALAHKPPKPTKPAKAAKTTQAQHAGGNGVICVRNTQLRAANEVPTSTSTAKGHAQIKVRRDGTIEYKIFVLNRAGETFTAGHIHEAPAGTAGPVVEPLFTGASHSARHIRLRGTIPAGDTTAAFREDLCEEPADYYVNLHTTANPAGAIRGQLGRR